jgi:hypothetical protein
MQGFRYVRSMFLVAALVGSAACQATLGMRIYDTPHQDYHVWDANEDRVYRQYEADQHRGHRDFSKLNSKEQSDYWDWRHQHPDRQEQR